MADIKNKADLEAFITSQTKGSVLEAFNEIRVENENKTKALETDFRAKLAEMAITHQAANAPEKEKGLMFARCVRAKAAVRVGISPTAEAFVDKNVKDGAWTKTVGDTINKALASSPTSVGGAIVPPGFSTELIELLYNITAMRKLGATIMPMETGNMTIPKLTAGVTGGYIGENQGRNAEQPAFGVINLSFKKLSCVVPLSNDLIRFSNPKADEVVKNDILQALAITEDQQFIRGTGSGVAPIGLKSLILSGNTYAANATVNLANVTTDLFKAPRLLEQQNIPMSKPGWIFSPRTKWYLMSVRDANGNFAFKDEMMRGTLLGFQFVSTNSIPSNMGGGTDESEIYFGDFNDAIIGESSELTVDVSQEAAYLDGSGTLTSAFALDQSVIRALARHDFNVRRAESFVLITTVKWV